jgi:hypothetical protein
MALKLCTYVWYGTVLYNYADSSSWYYLVHIDVLFWKTAQKKGNMFQSVIRFRWKNDGYRKNSFAFFSLFFFLISFFVSFNLKELHLRLLWLLFRVVRQFCVFAARVMTDRSHVEVSARSIFSTTYCYAIQTWYYDAINNTRVLTHHDRVRSM